MKDTTLIAFSGGSYGSYLEWVLTALTSTSAIDQPFTAIGNSHKVRGNHLSDMAGWKDYLNSNEQYQFAKLHPKTTKEESLSQNLNILANSAKRVIYLYPDPDSVLLVINNYFEKIWDNWWNYQFATSISQNIIYDNWPVDRSVSIEKIPPWIKREFLSFYLMPAWYDQVEWFHPDHWKHPNCIVITVSALLNQFEATVTKIKEFCSLDFARPVKELLDSHDQMLTLQKNQNQDDICNQIIKHVIAGTNYTWDHLTLVSESWIQWKLRNLGHELACHELDIFPTNSVQLQKLLYPTTP